MAKVIGIDLAGHHRFPEPPIRFNDHFIASTGHGIRIEQHACDVGVHHSLDHRRNHTPVLLDVQLMPARDGTGGIERSPALPDVGNNLLLAIESKSRTLVGEVGRITDATVSANRLYAADVARCGAGTLVAGPNGVGPSLTTKSGRCSRSSSWSDTVPSPLKAPNS